MGQAAMLIMSPGASFTRPNNGTAYTSGQLVANSTTAGSIIPLSFKVFTAGSMTPLSEQLIASQNVRAN